MTNDPDIRFASSLVDYVFRRLALDYLPDDKREALGIRSIEERTAAAKAEIEEKVQPGAVVDPSPALIPVTQKHTARVLDAPLCYQCGSKMQPAGSCYVCETCGSTSGCS